MIKLDYLKEQITKLNPDQRAQLDDFLIDQLAGDAQHQAKDYELVMSSDYIEEAERLRRDWGKMQGISTGYRKLDELTKGLVGGEVTVVAGPTSSGKTTLCVNITARLALAGHRILFVTLEMTKPQLTGRLLYATPNGYDFREYAANVVFQRVDELNWLSVDGLINTAVKEVGVDVVVIDHLHYFTRELENVAEDLGRITKEFKKNAIRHNVPILLISHTRKGEGNTINDLRGSSYIAQDADIVLMVGRDKDHAEQFFVACEKNRNRGYDYNDNVRGLFFSDTLISE